MMSGRRSQHLPDFSGLLDQFEAEWNSGEIPDIAAYFGQVDERNPQIIQDLIELDLECRWKQFDDNCDPLLKDPHGFPLFATLADYDAILPDSLKPVTRVPRFVAEEYRVRSRWGDKPSKESFFDRYSGDRSQIQQALDSIDAEFEVEGTQRAIDSSLSNAADVHSTLILEKPNSKNTTQVSESNLKETLVGKYRLESMLGRGGFGEVWKAYDPNLKRYVALKFPRPDKKHTPEMLEYFRREGEKMAALELVSGVVPVFEAGEHEGLPYIASYYVEGKDLGAHCKQSPLSFLESVRIVADVAETLHRAHLKNLFHRDVKLSNILIASDGRVFLSDLGLCISEEEQNREVRSIAGTCAYMAPEQIHGLSNHVDGRSDIYALGVVLYRLLTGRLPFIADNQADYFDQALHREPRPLRSIDDKIPASLERICLKCLAKRMGDRYSTAKDLSEELRATIIQSMGAMQPQSISDVTAETLSSFSSTTGYREVQPSGSVLSRLGHACLLGGGALLVLILISWGTGWSPVMFGLGDSAPDSGLITVNVLTNPPGARIVVYPIVPPYGFPNGELRVEAPQRSPTQLKLVPGEYLVVAALDDGRFHEVFRTIPMDIHSKPGNPCNHRRWITRVDDTIEWPKIKIPPADVVNGMALLGGDPSFAIGEPKEGPIPKHHRHVSSFYIETHEVTWEDYLANNKFTPPPSLLDKKDNLPDLKHPIAGLWYDEAVRHAERVGKRLPTEAEYEFAATKGGTQPFPWGDDAELFDEWQFGAAGTPSEDELNTNPPVYGLYSNVAEWTSSWASSYPPRMQYEVTTELARRDGEFIVRGGPFSVIDRKPKAVKDPRGPKQRVAQHKKEMRPGLGFRCVRSLHPRLEASALERYVPK